MNKKRDTFKKLIAVTTVAALAPASWTKPIISSVVLPTHAMTSTELTLNPVADIFISCGQFRKSDCSSDDPRVDVRSFGSSISGFTNFRMNIISGQNIDENAIYSVVNDPSESNSKLGRLTFIDNSSSFPGVFILRWSFDFVDGDEIPIDTFNLILRVENPNGESATTSVNITFS